LQRWYDPASGLYRSTGWWNSANAITALANYSRVSGSRAYLPVFANTLSAAQSGPAGAAGFLNQYYDDEGWWALAWIDVFDLTGEPRYLQTARTIFEDMQGGWDTATCGGGVWWSKKKRGKNAIENELFLAVAASLANREADEGARREDLAWAQREWDWFERSGMINGQHRVNDGLELIDGAHCSNNGKATWTYNQGVLLGGLIELNRAAPNPALLGTASAIADAALAHLTDAKHILREPNDAHSGADVPQFKGIFVRNLMLLNLAAPQARYRRFIRANARSLWRHDRNARDQFGFWWQGPVDQVDAARQSSGLDLLVAADSLSAAGRAAPMPPAP
jgi:predicted alpha-1,6-mannanase (GH76 family)